jgi:hypothetical protein
MEGMDTNLSPVKILASDLALYIHLTGYDPIDISMRDEHCWGTNNYSVKEGYRNIISDTPGPLHSNLWA